VKTKKAVAIAVSIAFVSAFISPLLVLHMMADNNNNGELYDTITGQWHAGYPLQVAAISYVPAFLALFAIAFGLARLFSDRADAP